LVSSPVSLTPIPVAPVVQTPSRLSPVLSVQNTNPFDEDGDDMEYDDNKNRFKDEYDESKNPFADDS